MARRRAEATSAGDAGGAVWPSWHRAWKKSQRHGGTDNYGGSLFRSSCSSCCCCNVGPGVRTGFAKRSSSLGNSSSQTLNTALGVCRGSCPWSHAAGAGHAAAVRRTRWLITHGADAGAPHRLPSPRIIKACVRLQLETCRMNRNPVRMNRNPVHVRFFRVETV